MSNTLIPQTEIGKNYILSIAIDKYLNTAEFERLDHSVSHLNTLFATLTNNYHFEETNIKKLHDSHATKSEIDEAFHSFHKKDFTGDDSLLIFFSGHGKLKGKDGYLILSDGDEYPHTELIKEIGKLTEFRNIILFLNYCHSGTIFSDKFNTSDTNFGEGFTKCRVAIASNQGRETTPDGSPFVSSITTFLGKNETNDISIDSVFEQIGFAMNAAEPQAFTRKGILIKDQGGKFYFKLRESEAVVWAKTLKLNSVEGFSLYLQRFSKNKHEAEIKRDELIRQENAWKAFLKQVSDKFEAIKGNNFAEKHLDVITKNNNYFSKIYSELEEEEKSNIAWNTLNKTDVDAVKNFIDTCKDSRFHVEAKIIHAQLVKANEAANDWDAIKVRVAARRSKFDDNQKDYSSYLAKYEGKSAFCHIVKKKYHDVSKYLIALSETEDEKKIQKLKAYIQYKKKVDEYKDYEVQAEGQLGRLVKEVDNKKNQEDIYNYFKQKSISKLKDFIETCESPDFIEKAEEYIVAIESEFNTKFEEVRKSDSVNQFVEAIKFFDDYSDASNYQEDIKLLKKEKDNSMYRLSTTIEGCENYILEFEGHECSYLPTVKSYLDELKRENRDFNEIQKFRLTDLHQAVDLCEMFFVNHTNGMYTNEVTKINSECTDEIKDDAFFSEISKGFTIDNCRDYLKTYTKYKDIVNTEFDRLKKDERDEDSYQNIISESEKEVRLLSIQELIQLCRNYRIEFENGNFNNEVDIIFDQLLIDQNEEDDYNEMINVNTIDGVKVFFGKHSQGRKKADADALLNELEENERKKAEEIEKDNNDFARATQLGTKEAFQEYLALHPKGLDFNRKEANKNIKILLLKERDGEAFEKAKAINTIDAYKDYLLDFENPISAVKANENIDKLDRIKKDRETFDKAIIENKIELYSSYITEFSKDGKFVPEIMAAMNKLMFGNTLPDIFPTKKNTEINNEWLKPASILQIISIILLIVLIFFVKR